MKWHESTPEERNRLVAEKVMGWQEKPCSEQDTPPDYTRDMNAAWQVLQHTVKEHCIQDVWGDYDEVWDRFCYHLNTTSAAPNVFLWIVTWTPDLLCQAAYYAVTGEAS